MTVTRPKTASSDLAILLIVVGVVVGVGSAVVGAKYTLIAVGAPAVVLAALFVVRRPLLTLIAMIVIELANLAEVIAKPIFHLSLVLGLVAVCIALCDAEMRARFNRWTVLGLGLVAFYLITQLVAALTSQNFGVSLATLKEAAIDCVFLVVILLLAQFSGRPWMVAAAIVLPLAGLSALCLINQLAFGGAATFGGFATAANAADQLITTWRFGGPSMDPNFWGRNLILGLPLAGALIVREAQSGRRWLAVGWAAALASLLAGVYLTQSRGTIICTAMVFIVWVLASGRVARRRGLLALPPLMLLLLVPGIGDRLVDLVTDVSGSAAKHSVDPSVLGRAAAQEMAWQMFRDRPMFGFGPGVFEASVPSYAGIVPTAVLHPTEATHNLYAQLAAESGVVGLEGWAVLVGGFIGLVTIRMARSSARAESDRSLAAAVLAAVIGWSAASLFLHLSYFRAFAIVLALAAALVSVAAPRKAGAQRALPGRMRDITVGAMVGIAGAATALAASMHETYVASRTVTLLPTEQVAGFYAYALDVRSREVVLPTYAAMMAVNAPGMSADPDAVRGVITMKVAAADSYSAQAGLDIAMANAHTNLANFGADTYYALAAVGPVEVASRGSRPPAATPLAVLTAAACAATTVVMMQRISARPRRLRSTARRSIDTW